jgi:hypothetical protein
MNPLAAQNIDIESIGEARIEAGVKFLTRVGYILSQQQTDMNSKRRIDKHLYTFQKLLNFKMSSRIRFLISDLVCVSKFFL